MAKRKEQRTNNDLQNTTQKTKDQTTRTPLKPGFVTRVTRTPLKPGFVTRVTRTPLKPGFVTRVTRHVPIMEHELLTLDL
jgi:hypothetical protein